MTTIDLTIHAERLERAVKRARERNIIIPTYAQQRNPELVPASIKSEIRGPRIMGYRPPESLPHHLEE